MTATGGHHRATLLIVDDTPGNLSLLVDALDAAGYRPLIANSGEAALRRLLRMTPDLILLDLRMPGMDGIETCARLKRNPRWQEIPVIFMTAVEEPEQKVQAFAAGAADYVTKPFHTAEVLARINAHLKLRALQYELERELAWREETERTLRASLEQGVAVATSDGALQFATHRAERLLCRYFPEFDGESLPASIGALIKAPPSPLSQPQFHSADGILAVRIYAPRDDETRVMLLLEETRPSADRHALRELGLSVREAEVLYWIAQGKTNGEIGTIIGAALGTVKKHAENLYPKLGVESRNGAIRVALDALRTPAEPRC